MSIVVSDTSPIRALDHLQLLDVLPLLDRLQNELRFFIGRELRDEILRDVGES